LSVGINSAWGHTGREIQSGQGIGWKFLGGETDFVLILKDRIVEEANTEPTNRYTKKERNKHS
jgi:hypothetical protein